MQKLIILVITLGTLFGCKSQSKKRLTKLTVIYSNNERLDFKMIIDTLIREREINLSDTTIDIFYGNKNFHFPYYVPSGGIYKDSIKNSECDMTIQAEIHSHSRFTWP